MTTTRTMMPDSNEHTRLSRFFAALRRADATEPSPRTVAVWDKAHSRFRQVDPTDTADLLQAAARAIASFEDQTSDPQPASPATDRSASRSAQRRASLGRRALRWLPSVTMSRASPQQHAAACYLAAARRAAAAGDHFAAQHAAQCCIALSAPQA